MLFGEQEEERVDHEQKAHAHKPHDRKMKLFVGQKEGRCIIDLQELVMDARNAAHHII